jgi:hypothetical protein
MANIFAAICYSNLNTIDAAKCAYLRAIQVDPTKLPAWQVACDIQNGAISTLLGFVQIV